MLGTDDLYREMGYVAMSRGRNGDHLYVVGEPTREIEPLHGPSLERTAEDLLVSSLSTSRTQTMASCESGPLLAEALLLAAEVAARHGDDLRANELVDLAASVASKIWNPRWLTAHGPLVERLEQRMRRGPDQRRDLDVVERTAATSSRRSLCLLAAAVALTTLLAPWMWVQPAHVVAAPTLFREWHVSGQTWYASQSNGYSLLFTLKSTPGSERFGGY